MLLCKWYGWVGIAISRLVKWQEGISVECQPPRLCDSNDKCKQVGGVPVQLGQALYGGGGRVSVYGDVHYIMGTDRQTWLKTLPWWAVIKVDLESGFLGWLTPVSVGARVTSISSDRKRRDATRRVRDCLHWEKANISLWSLHHLVLGFVYTYRQRCHFSYCFEMGLMLRCCLDVTIKDQRCRSLKQRTCKRALNCVLNIAASDLEAIWERRHFWFRVRLV